MVNGCHFLNSDDEFLPEEICQYILWRVFVYIERPFYPHSIDLLAYKYAKKKTYENQYNDVRCGTIQLKRGISLNVREKKLHF